LPAAGAEAATYICPWEDVMESVPFAVGQRVGVIAAVHDGEQCLKPVVEAGWDVPSGSYVVIEQGRRGHAGREGRSVLKVVETGGSGQVSPAEVPAGFVVG